MSRREVLKKIKEREEYWSKKWEEAKIFVVKRDENKKKFFVTFPFPYMNGSLHLGHGFTATRLDVIARYKRMRGFNVLYPWAWHWTGEAVMGICHRIEDGNKDVIDRLIRLDGVPPNEIEKFKDPIYLVKFFTKRGKEDVKRLALSIDWSREFHTSNLHPLYTKFVEWQIRKLFNKGYIVQGPYPVVWCPKDQSPTGDHDRLVGEGIRPEEYTLIKFKLVDEDVYLVAATFRPETIFGTTNIWLNPDVEYVIAKIDEEMWLISKVAAKKLSEQLRKVEVIKLVRGGEYIGKFVAVPIINRIVPILPANFVDPEVATGVVYSVPAHAPYDWLALKDLKENIDALPDAIRDVVQNLYPISIIAVEGYGEYPAVEICEKMGIKSQNDPRADEATQEIYSKEFHTGVMKDNCLDVAGLRVEEAKEAVKDTLIKLKLGDIMYDLPSTVICRCGTKCIVKILEDQWSLKYSDESWKSLAKEAINSMNFYPKELRGLFIQYVDWYRDWPCTRKTGLGTPFPFDKSWIVETLTDSTVYMAFYIISKYYNEGKIDPTLVDDSFFDYVILGIGNEEDLVNKGFDINILREIRRDFLYWYPVDLRCSGKDLIGNHLTFFIFHHVAIFPKQLWPRGIAANGFVKLEGKPMSKSSGNYISLRDAMDLFGADALRVSLVLGADGLNDPDWYYSDAEAYMLKINGFIKMVNNLIQSCIDRDYNHHDKVFITKLKSKVRDVEDALENVEVARAGRIIINDIPNLLREYLKLVDRPAKRVIDMFVDIWVRMLSLYAPYTAEEIWKNVLKNNGFIALQSWISSDSIEEYPEDIAIEKYALRVLDDIREIIRVVKKPVSNVKIVISSKWKWTLFSVISEILGKKEAIKLKELIPLVLSNLSKYNIEIDKKTVSTFVQQVFRLWFSDYAALEGVDMIIKSEEDEHKVMSNYVTDYIKRILNMDVEVSFEDEVKDEKAKKALPLKPALILY